jgi:hypothetical protein
MSTPRIALLLSIFAVGAATVFGGSAAAHSPTAHTAAALPCSIAGKERKFGVSYQTALSVKGTTCKAGIKTMKAYHACRKLNGVAGTCSTPVNGFTCTEQRQAVPKVQYTASVKCKKGGKRVLGSYTQNL